MSSRAAVDGARSGPGGAFLQSVRTWAAQARTWLASRPRPTTRGVILILTSAVAMGFAFALHSRPLMLISLFFLALMLALGIILAARVRFETRPNSALALRVSRSVAPAVVAWGTRADVTLRVDGGKWSAAPAAREQVARALLPLVPGQGAYEVTGSQRGVWPIGPLSAQRVDPLGTWSARYDLGPTTEVMVWPQVVELEQHPFGGWALEPGPPAQYGPVRARLDDMTLREYRQGDELRRIHWRASARRGQLVVRAAEPADPYCLTIALLLPYRGHDSDAAAEWLISAAASAACAAFSSRARVRVVCGTDLPATTDATLLSALARLEVPTTPDAARRLAAATATSLHQGAAGACLVLTGVALPEELAVPLARFEPVWSASCGLARSRKNGPSAQPAQMFSPRDDVAAALTLVLGTRASRSR